MEASFSLALELKYPFKILKQNFSKNVPISWLLYYKYFIKYKSIVTKGGNSRFDTPFKHLYKDQLPFLFDLIFSVNFRFLYLSTSMEHYYILEKVRNTSSLLFLSFLMAILSSKLAILFCNSCISFLEISFKSYLSKELTELQKNLMGLFVIHFASNPLSLDLDILFLLVFEMSLLLIFPKNPYIQNLGDLGEIK